MTTRISYTAPNWAPNFQKIHEIPKAVKDTFFKAATFAKDFFSRLADLPRSFSAKILRIPVFRSALNDNFSKTALYFYNYISSLFGGSFKSFDETRAQKSVDRFVALGAEIQFITPRDGQGKIQMMTFRAVDLENKIISLGGSWGKITHKGKEVFAIIPPKTPTKAWETFKEKLDHFHFEETTDGKLITCDNADLIGNQTNCFLYAHTTVRTFATDWKRAGFYLGAKQDLCFFDNGNTWKNFGRRNTEESFYLEAEAVSKEISTKYQTDNIWVGGFCGSAPVAAHLKKEDPRRNVIIEHGIFDIEDFKSPLPSLVPHVKRSLNEGAIPLDVLENPPARHQFNINEMWKDLPRENSSKCVFVQVEKDEYISEEAYKKNLSFTQKVNAKVDHITYSTKAKSPHADDFFNNAVARRQFCQAVFS